VVVLPDAEGVWPHEQHHVQSLADLLDALPLQFGRHTRIGVAVPPGRCVKHHPGVGELTKVRGDDGPGSRPARVLRPGEQQVGTRLAEHLHLAAEQVEGAGEERYEVAGTCGHQRDPPGALAVGRA